MYVVQATRRACENNEDVNHGNGIQTAEHPTETANETLEIAMRNAQIDKRQNVPAINGENKNNWLMETAQYINFRPPGARERSKVKPTGRCRGGGRIS